MAEWHWKLNYKEYVYLLKPIATYRVQGCGTKSAVRDLGFRSTCALSARTGWSQLQSPDGPDGSEVTEWMVV